MTWMSLVLITLATARITRLITDDFILDKPRNALILKTIYRFGEGCLLSYLLVCPWCMSVYVGAVVTGAWWAWGETMWFVTTTTLLSASYLTGFLAKKGGGE